MGYGWLVCCVGVAACRAGFDPVAGEPECTRGPFAADFETVPGWAIPYQVGTASWNIGDGALQIDTGTALDTAYAGLRTAPFAFKNQRIAVEIAEMVNTTSDARAYLCLSNCQSTAFEAILRQQRGTLVVEVASLGGVITTRAYAPVDHRFWQVREVGGMLAWETSPDGVTWSTLTSYATPASAATAELWLGAWNNGAVGAGAVTFRSFRSCLEP